VRVAIIGRSRPLLLTAETLVHAGHTVAIVATCQAESHYRADQDEFRRLADRLGAVFVCTRRIGDEDAVARFRAADCDVAVSVNWPTMIGRDLISCFPYGLLNAHAGDLPRYRGNACPNWAILCGEPFVGLCVHTMDADALDAGPVLMRDRFALTDDTYIADVYAWLDRRIPSLFTETLDALGRDEIVAQVQSNYAQDILRCYPRRPEDGRVDWTRSAVDVHRLVRASSRPFAGAFTTLDGDGRITVWRAELDEHNGRVLAVPGQVLYISHGAPVIACGQGVLRLTEIETGDGSEDCDAKALVGRSLRNRLV
jgi:methionyl-tRNA formyltransferase